MIKRYKRTLLDAELLREIQKDDEHAFYEIYLRYHALLLIYAHRKLADKEEAKDIVQDVFIHLWNNRKQLMPDLALSPYLYKAVLNGVLNIYKHKNVLDRFANEMLAHQPVEATETDFLIREKELKALIEHEIENMPPRMREIYRLKKEYYLSTKAIAEQLELSEHTVSTQLKRAAKLLKDRFGLVVYLLYILR